MYFEVKKVYYVYLTSIYKSVASSWGLGIKKSVRILTQAPFVSQNKCAVTLLQYDITEVGLYVCFWSLKLRQRNVKPVL